MPLFYQQDINQDTRLAVWEISEAESFFLEKVSLKKEIMHPQKRLQHLAGRYLLGYLFPDFPAELIEIADTRKPFLPNEQYHFSISHCGNFAAAIVSKTERVGIDVELLTPRVEKIKHKFLHPAELQMVDHANIDRIQLLTLLWSAKEAMFKWWGNGDVDNELQGKIDVSFQKNEIDIALPLDYRLMNELTLCWVNHTYS